MSKPFFSLSPPPFFVSCRLYCDEAAELLFKVNHNEQWKYRLMAIGQKSTLERKTVVFNSRVNPFLFMKNHDKFLSTFPCNLEKEYVNNLYFCPFPPSLLVGSFVTCGFWGCHLWPLTLSLAAFEPLICHKWEPQSIALTALKHRFWGLIKCKKNRSC